MKMIPGGMHINTSDPDDEEMHFSENIDRGFVDSDLLKETLASISQAEIQASIVAIHDQAIQQDPGIRNNDVIELQAIHKDQLMAAEIISAAFFYNEAFKVARSLIDENKKAAKDQDNENGVPTAKSAMARWAFPILYESIKGIRSSFTDERENEKEPKIEKVKDRIKQPLIQKLASNYYHGSGRLSFFKGPICEKTYKASFRVFFWNLIPTVQHAYADPVLRFTHPSADTEANDQKQAMEKELDALKRLTTRETIRSIMDVNEPTFQSFNLS